MKVAVMQHSSFSRALLRSSSIDITTVSHKVKRSQMHVESINLTSNTQIRQALYYHIKRENQRNEAANLEHSTDSLKLHDDHNAKEQESSMEQGNSKFSIDGSEPQKPEETLESSKVKSFLAGGKPEKDEELFAAVDYIKE